MAWHGEWMSSAWRMSSLNSISSLQNSGGNETAENFSLEKTHVSKEARHSSYLPWHRIFLFTCNGNPWSLASYGTERTYDTLTLLVTIQLSTEHVTEQERRKRRLNSALSTAPNMWIEKVTTDKIYKSTWYGIVNNKWFGLTTFSKSKLAAPDPARKVPNASLGYLECYQYRWNCPNDIGKHFGKISPT